MNKIQILFKIGEGKPYFSGRQALLTGFVLARTILAADQHFGISLYFAAAAMALQIVYQISAVDFIFLFMAASAFL